ncbi:putative non-ribosomal peptide synthetase [Astrocystis sublimbata]|nr:putative non-ribosomal peptide synthetase [Astrocystis sublimbata]
MSPDHQRSLHMDDGVSIVNARPQTLPGPRFLHELVPQANNDGLSAAIDFLSESGQRTSLSYAELHAASLSLACSIARILGSASCPMTSTSASRDPLVIPILSPQSPQLYVAILAALKAGGAFCPLNADAPPDRVRFILQDVRAQIVLVTRKLAPKLPTNDQNYKFIIIDDILDSPEAKGYGIQSLRELEPEDLAYVMYTSGSTGTPKGVAVSHLAVTQSILAHEQHIPTFSRFLQFAAPTFDVSIFEIFFPLFRGATLVGCNRTEILLKQRSRAPCLQLLLTIGEMLTEPVIKEFGGNEDNVSILWGMYGPTEAAIHCTVQAAFRNNAARSVIGIPFDTVSAFVIRVPNENDGFQFEALPLGEIGELALGGFQLATCYLNRPQQTAASFVDTRWGRVYRTGDKARIRQNGTIECLGRIEEGQVKLHGQRLELGEIEQVLLRTPGCHSAVVAVISNILVAFAAVEQDIVSDVELSAQCRSWLPAFMVPLDIVTMRQLPQLPSGKVDRKRLIKDYMAREENSTENEETIDDCERLLCETATAIIGERVGPLTMFSAAKLDSLAAIEFASTLREKRISVSPLDVLSARTPRELRQRIQDAATPSPVSSEATLPMGSSPSEPSLDKTELRPTLGGQIHGIDRIEETTPLQRSMIAETLKDTRLYINQVELELISPATLEVVQSSLRKLADCNEILRTGFAFIQHQPCQLVWKQLEEAQIYQNSDVNNSKYQIDDAEAFLLRPLNIGIRRSKSEANKFILLLTLHHAIYDGWTIDLIIEDLSLLLSGKLPTKRPQFSQVMRHLRYNSEPEAIDSMEFWTEQLRGVGASPASSLRTEVVLEPQLVVATTTIPIHPKSVTDLMLKASVGPQVLFQACLAWLWTAVQGGEDIVIGSVSSGRSLPLSGIDKLMGPCMMTLPLRINVSRYRTITELLQSIHSINRQTLRHGHIPLSNIKKAAGLSTSSNLFDVIFAYQESPASRRNKSNTVRETWHRDATEFKLVVEIQPCEDHFIFQTTSQTSVLPQQLTESFARHLITLMDYFSSHFDAPIESIPTCFPFDTLSHFNDDPKSLAKYRSLNELVECTASRSPSAPALAFARSIQPSAVDSTSLSYHELNSKANQIARHLKECDAGPGGLVAIIMNKSPLLYCSILGILKSGCAYLPILPSTPIERVKVILHQAEPVLCVVDTASSSLELGEGLPKIVNMETSDFSLYASTNLTVHTAPSELAYVIYTSGTTGIPKGVAVTNLNISSNINILSSIYPHDQSSRMLQACSQAFDVSVFEIFFAWANGMCLCAATNDTLFEDFEQSVRLLMITHLSPTVTVASLLNPINVPSVKFLVTSGEPMTDEVLDRWAQHLYQGYGPSETTNICTVRKVSRGDSAQFLGWAFENTSTFVMAPNSEHLVPVGCLGELCFGGDQVASGYLKLPEATATKFINHPSYGRLYRSGDLGRMLPDGSLLIQGRIDTQVKMRGLRIELQEIQAIALRTGLTRACKSVLIMHQDTNQQQLSLFYVPSDYDTTKFQLLPLLEHYRDQSRTIRLALESCLPDYMVPTFIVPISSLPLTSSGKIDEGQLSRCLNDIPHNEVGAYSFTEDHPDAQSDWSETETLIADVITDLRGNTSGKLSRWTSFSALGLDSISAMPVARKLQSTLGKRIPLSLLLLNPNVNRLASAIDTIIGNEEPLLSRDPLLPTEMEAAIRKRFTSSRQSITKVLPCTPLQEIMVMSSLSSPAITTNGVAYYNQLLFHLHAPHEVIMGLWNQVVRRHEVLRALFVASDNLRYPAIQVILEDYVLEWEVLQAEGDSPYELASKHIASASSIVPDEKPPMALAIIRTKTAGDYLSFVCHHAMYDGVSMQIILSEIEALHGGSALAEPPSMEPFLREVKLSNPGSDDFWKQLFVKFQLTPLECKKVTSGDTMPRTVPVKAPSLSLKLIESQLRDMGVSMLAFVQTGWALTLSILCQRSDVSLGSVVTGRSIPLDLVDTLVAPCFNTLPLRMDLSRSMFLTGIMKGFQNLNAEVLQYQFTNLRHVQKEVAANTRLFDTLLILQPPATPLDDSLWSLVYEDGFMDVPIVCEVIPHILQDTLTIQLHRDKSKFSLESLQLIGNIFTHILETCLKYPSSHLITRQELPEQMQNDISYHFNAATRDSQASNTIPYETPLGRDAWSPTELTVRRTLAKLAEIPEEKIERFTPIYRYGVDSITAIQLATLLRRQEVSISAIDVIENPTCAGIAGAINDAVEALIDESHNFSSFRKEVEGGMLGCGINFETVETVLPCTATQQGLLSQFLESGGQYYFNYSCWVLNRAASSEAMARAWSTLVSHHQILRAGFVPVNHPDSSFAMLVYMRSAFAAPVVEFQTDSFDAQEWLSNATDVALNTMTQPPWRLAIVTSRDSNNENMLTIHLAMHHALYDAFTLQRLLHDLDELMSTGDQLEVERLDSHLSQYLGLIHSNKRGAEVFWKKKAADFVSHRFPMMTTLYVTSAGSSRTSRICEVSSSLIRRAASQAEVTVQVALQAAWTRLLSTYVGEPRVAFGVVFDGRTTELARNSTLPMITTLPVIAENVSSNSDLLQQMMLYNSELRRFQFTPMAQIQRSIGTTEPLFDTILIYQAVDKSKRPLPFRSVKELASVEYPVSLEVEESSCDTTMLSLVYRDSVLPQEQAAILLSQFEAILMDLISSRKDATFRLDIEKPELFSSLSPDCDTLPIEGHLLHELLERSSQLSPSAIALEFIDDMMHLHRAQKWTYQQLDALGNQVAHFITKNRVSPGSIIATCFNKCPIAYFTLLGILKAGCAFLCLDPSAPAARQLYILNDSNAAMLLLNEHFEWMDDASLPSHTLNENLLGSFPTSRPPLQRQTLPSDSCYCLYTSGTTGAPKGCLISHENAVQAMAAFTYLFTGRWDSNSRWLQFAAFHFDVSVLEQYWSWHVGIAVVAVPKDVILSDLAMTISKLEITHIDLTPSLAKLITPDEVPSLCKGVFITGGEKLRSDILETWGAQRVIHNAYGPTEATIGVTMFCGMPENGRPSNIGTLFPNVGAYIFERGTETPVLRGGVGELCVSGKLVGKGYLNRDTLTKDRFPVLQASKERIYRTGDLVRVLHDNSLDFIGRADDQVKLRGQRLEIGEINHVIRDGLANKAGDVATLVARRKGQDIDLLVSFIAPTSEFIATRELQVYHDAKTIEFARRAQEACRSHLAIYMVPSFIICVSHIPLSSNNKVDVNRLRKFFSELSHEQLQSLSATAFSNRGELSRLESQISKAIQEVIKVEGNDILPTSTIFELGIDSIKATRVANQLRIIGFASATPSMILRYPQISQLAQALGQSSSGTSSNTILQAKQSIKAFHQRYIGLACGILKVDATEIEYVAPCTPLQQGILARSKTREAQLTYFNQFRLRLDTEVSIERLKGALCRVIESCSILRTAFVDTHNGIMQVAMKTRPLRWFEVDSATKPFEHLAAERQQNWIEANQHVLEWPLEVDHVEYEGQHHLLLRLFHGIYDARSLTIVLDSLEAEYEGTVWSSGPEFISVLPQGPLLGHEESYPFWKSLLKNHRLQPMPSLTDDTSATSSLLSEFVKLKGLENKSKQLQVTHQTLLQAAWLCTLRQYFVDPPTIGVILSGRSIAVGDVDLVVGPLFNTLPLRVDDAKNTSWASLTQEVQKLSNGLLAFVHTPLRDIQKICTRGQPLFDTLFTFDRDIRSSAKSKPSPWSIQDSLTHPDYPLAIEIIMVEDDMLRFTLAAQGNIANESALKLLLNNFTESLHSLIGSSPEAALPLATHTPHPKTKARNSHSVQRTYSTIDKPMSASKEKFSEGSQSYGICHEVAIIAKVDEAELSEATNLFALGLDSIDIIKLSGRLNKLGYNVSIGMLMKEPTLERIIASVARSAHISSSASDTSDFDRTVSILTDHLEHTDSGFSSVEAILPPTPLQDSMVAEMLSSDFKTYFNHDVLRLPDDLDIDHLKLALSELYANSPILRTVFVEVEDPRISSAYCQVVRKHTLEFPPTVQITGKSGVSTLTDSARKRALGEQGKSSLFQIQFAELETETVMVLSIAHALYDGWSLNMLHQDIKSAYERNYVPRPSYTPYISRIFSVPRSSSQRFWKDLMHGAHATFISQTSTISQQIITHRLEKRSRKGTATIREVCKSLRVTPQVLGQACWAAVLASLTGSLDVVFGVVLSGRETEEAQELMFPTMNTVPVRLALHGHVAGFLEYCQDIMSSIMEFQHTPLRDIQKLSETRGGQLFDTIFLLQNSANDEADSEPFLKSEQSVSAVDYLMCIELELTGDDAVWRIACDNEYMSSQEVTNLGTSLENVLDYFARDENNQVLQFSSHVTQMVSICGLDQVALQTDLQQREGHNPTGRPGSQRVSSRLQGQDTLIEVLSDLSKVNKREIDLSLSIFHIGLDSISAIKASSMLRKRGLNISTRDLVAAPSLHDVLELANRDLVEQERPAINWLYPSSHIGGQEISTLVQKAGLDVDAIETILPALPMQVHTLSVWINSCGATFFPNFAFKMSGHTNLAAVSKAWIALVEENAMLRTHLISTEASEPPYIQAILKSKFASSHARSSANEANGRWEFIYAATPFVAVQFLGEDSGDAFMNLYIHHALYDGVSLPMILNRFAEICSLFQSPPTSIPTRWYEFAQRHLDAALQGKHALFWTTYLEGSTHPGLFQTHDTPPAVRAQRTSDFRSATIDNADRLRERGSVKGISTQALLYAALARVIAKLDRRNEQPRKNPECVFGIYLANRSSHPGIEEAPFPTLSILPLRVKDPLGRSIDEVAGDIQKDITEISRFENASASLWEIEKWTGVRIDTFVNILSLPSEQSPPETNHVKLEKITNNDLPPTSGADMSAYLISSGSKSISSSPIIHSYQVSNPSEHFVSISSS